MIRLLFFFICNLTINLPTNADQFVPPINPYEYMQNITNLGDSMPFIFTGTKNQMACGVGCLKCNSLQSGNVLNGGYYLVGCLACDNLNGWGMVDQAYCVKTTDPKCYQVTKYLDGHGFDYTMTKPNNMPCAVC